MKIILFFLILFLTNACRSQPEPGLANSPTQIIGGPCEGCEVINDYAAADLWPIDTLPDYNRHSERLKVTGTIFQADGKTPAENVILYIYQTNEEGHYQMQEDSGEQYVYHRGWIKTGEDGKYTFYTFLPGAYPGREEPRHIHPLIKEANGDVYYIDEFVFDHDPLLTGAKRKVLENRGGSGVLRLLKQGDLLVGERNIILGLNIPNYPGMIKSELESGRQIGEDVLSFTPIHAWGPDKGTKTCPVCKYGRYHGLLFFVGNHPDWDSIKKWLNYLEMESADRQDYLKAYFIYGNDKDYSPEKRSAELEQIGRELDLQYVALTFVPSFLDENSEVSLNKINPEVNNTILLYRHSNIVDKFINMEPTPANFTLISQRLEQTKNEYFDLPAFKNE